MKRLLLQYFQLITCFTLIHCFPNGYDFVYNYSVRFKYVDSSNQSILNQLTFYSTVTIENLDINEYNVKFSNINFKVNEVIQSAELHELFDDYLKQSFRVRKGNDGVDLMIRTLSNETLFTLNIKRGLVTLYELQFSGSKLNETEFEVKEATINGICDTKYNVRKSVPKFLSDSEEMKNLVNGGTLFITKQRKLIDCEQNYRSESLFKNKFMCNSKGMDDRKVMYFYSIEDKNGYLLRKTVISKEDNLIDLDFDISSVINAEQRLVLVESRKSSQALQTDMVTQSSIIGNVTDEKFYSVNVAKFLSNEAIRKFDTFYSYISKNKVDISDTDPNGELIDLIDFLTTVDREVIENFFENGRIGESKPKEDLFYQILGIVGTYNAFKFVKANFDENKYSSYFKYLPFTVKGFNEKFGRKLGAFCFENIASSLGKDCLLAFSSIVNFNCLKTKSNDNCAKLINDIVNNANEALQSQANTDRLMLAVKSIKNLGFNEGFGFLEAVFSNKQLPLILRIEAVWAVASIHSNGNRSSVVKLIQIINDNSDDHEIRIAAFYSLFATGATVDELNSILSNLKENDKQLNSYIYSFMKMVTDSKIHICHNDYRESIVALFNQMKEKMQRFSNIKPFDSQVILTDYESSESILLGIISGKKTFIPQALIELSSNRFQTNGLAIRAIGADFKQLLINFTKSDLNNEINLEKLLNLLSEQFRGEMVFTQFVNGKDLTYRFYDNDNRDFSSLFQTELYLHLNHEYYLSTLTASGFPYNFKAFSLATRKLKRGSNNSLNIFLNNENVILSTIAIPLSQYVFGIGYHSRKSANLNPSIVTRINENSSKVHIEMNVSFLDFENGTQGMSVKANNGFTLFKPALYCSIDCIANIDYENNVRDLIRKSVKDSNTGFSLNVETINKNGFNDLYENWSPYFGMKGTAKTTYSKVSVETAENLRFNLVIDGKSHTNKLRFNISMTKDLH